MAAKTLDMNGLLALQIGTVLEAGRMLPAVTAEPVVHQVVATDAQARTLRVRSTFFGVRLGYLVATEVGGAIQWNKEANL